MKRRTILQAPALLCLPALSRAQSFPTKPIRYIVPVAAGGGNDMIARVVTERWGKALGQNFIVDNQGGGGGVIASVATARAAPDGYTLMQGYVATHGTTPATRKVPYDAIKDFTPIGMIGGTPNVLVVNSTLPVKTLAEFIDHAQEEPRPPQLRLGRPGLAHPPHHGALQAADRRVHAAHSLSRHRAGVHRPARRPDPGDVPRPRRGAAAPALGARARARRDRQAAQRPDQGRADARGVRLQGVRCDPVVRLGRPGGHPRRRRAPSQRSAGRGAEGSRRCASACRSRRSSRCR